MTRPSSLLGIDVGTSRIKAAVVDSSGDVLAVSDAPTPFVAAPGGIEMSAAVFLDAVRAAVSPLRDLLDGVDGVGIASMGETGTLIGPDGPAEIPLIAWHDARGASTVARIRAELGREVLRRTGREARTVSSIAKLGWLSDHGADVSGRFVGVAGLLLWRLTGEVRQEESLAASSGCFDPYGRRYDPEILRAAGLPDLGFAAVGRAGEVMGRITRDGSHWLGLRPGVPVTIAGHDHPVGVVGAGGRPGDVVDSMGTGEPLVAAWAPPAGDRAHPVLPGGLDGDMTVCAWPSGGDALMILWEILRPGMGLGHLARLLGLDRARIEREAIDIPAEGLAFRLLLDLQAGVAGIDALPSGEPAEIWAAALEGYSEATADAELSLRELTGARGPTVLIGGGTRSVRWVQAKTRRAVYPLLLAEEPEAVARGAALIAGIAAGRWEPEQMPASDMRPLAYAGGAGR